MLFLTGFVALQAKEVFSFPDTDLSYRLNDRYAKSRAAVDDSDTGVDWLCCTNRLMGFTV